jgi:1,5-anhydro-D-fructose reductase (1,5-anhydro-D-mannitol-forming)
VSWAFLGAGRHARLWLGPALVQARNARAVGVWSRDPAHAADFASAYGVERSYATLDEALADPEVEAVLISTPNNLHADHAMAAVRAGKHALVEKPFATTVSAARELARTADDEGRQLGVGFHLRHNTVAQAARDAIAAGKVGVVQYVSAQFNLISSPPPRLQIAHAPWKRDPDQIGGASALMGQGVHVIDLVRSLVGREVVSVSAFAAGSTAESPLESFAQVLLDFGGPQAHLVYGGAFPLSRNDVVVYGSEGRLTLENVVDVVSSGVLELARPDGQGGVRIEGWRPGVPDHYVAQIEAFGRAIRNGESFSADGWDGVRSVEIASAVIISQRTGQRVAIEEAAQ